jgi:DNA polymerase II small subunit
MHNVSSPSVITIHKSNTFEGFTVLLYHGCSFFYYLDVEEIRKNGGIDRIDTVMEFLLKRRHLAPAHTSTQFMPDPTKDDLMIEEVPDFFVTGHIHKSVVRNYKQVTMMSCSCFVNVTDYQKKQGMIPDLAKVTTVNLRTREVKILDFL